jgi:purine-binding chemotaxis protein CheW
MSEQAVDNLAGNVGADERQYVTFEIGQELYGVGVLKVMDIIGMTQITPVPNTLHFMKGVINLRGSVVPVIDLRAKFNMDLREYDNFTVIIIVEVKERKVGMIVDAVSDVVAIPVGTIQDTPHFSAKIETSFIEGIGQKDDQLIIILNAEKILSVEELDIIDRDKVQ